MRYLILAAWLVFLPTLSIAQNLGSIVHVTKALKMNSQEPPQEKVFFVDLGQEDGLNPGQLLEIYRIFPVKDTKSGGDYIQMAIGELQIHRVGLRVSSAKMVKVSESLSKLNEPFLMIGDLVEAKTNLPFQ